MNSKWEIVYYETATGECFISDFIDSRSKRNQAKILTYFTILKNKGQIFLALMLIY